MNSIQASISYLKGTSYEIGRLQGEEIKKNPNAMNVILSSESIDETKYKDTKQLIDQYAPGLNEELQGFADSLNIKPSCLNFLMKLYYNQEDVV